MSEFQEVYNILYDYFEGLYCGEYGVHPGYKESVKLQYGEDIEKLSVKIVNRLWVVNRNKSDAPF